MDDPEKNNSYKRIFYIYTPKKGSMLRGGSFSHTEGFGTTANGFASHAEGYVTIAGVSP